MKIDILGIKINRTTAEEVLEKIENFLKSKNSHYIVTANPEMIIAAQKDGEFRGIINKADLVVPDGIGLLWASKFLSITKSNKKILPERISGVDLIYKICQRFQNSDYSIFLLGAKEGVAKRAGERLKKNYPSLKIAGVDSTVITKNGDVSVIARRSPKRDDDEAIPLLNSQNCGIGIASLLSVARNDNVIKKINQIKPDILFVAFGAPKQEKWIAGNLKKIPSVRLAIGVGGAFDFISGKTKRAPKIVRRVGLEWLWRLLLQPWRVKRISTATAVFGWKVLRNKLKVQS